MKPKWSYAVCSRCGHIALSPLPKTYQELEQWYSAEYYADHELYPDYDTVDSVYDHLVKQRLQQLEALQSAKGRLLDVGCGMGHFLNLAVKNGWEGYGTEISQAAVATARKRFGLNVFAGPLSQAAYPAGYFDVVTYWDVLEHLGAPRDDLRLTYHLMKPDGLLAITMPNKDGVKARIQGERWRFFRPEYGHIMHYSPQTLTTLLQQTGFETVLVKTTGFFNLKWVYNRLSALSRLSVVDVSLSQAQRLADGLMGWLGIGELITLYARRRP
ncbi:MAG: methyltransferase domain-containing protein [Anaerolineae bacterium]|nr:methyltransferase domain-containing protein [Anaerolineae bacterium]